MNSFAKQYGLTTRQVSVSLAKAIPILFIVQLVPIVGYVAAIAYLICLFMYMHQVAYTAADMIDATTKPA
jgi:hypothetical protein